MPASQTTTISISAQTQQTIRALVEKMHLPPQEIVEHAVEGLRRKLLFEEANAVYAALQEQPDAWQEIEQERRAWDATQTDSLEKEDWSEYKSPTGV